jgi:hypothetical protein
MLQAVLSGCCPTTSSPCSNISRPDEEEAVVVAEEVREEQVVVVEALIYRNPNIKENHRIMMVTRKWFIKRPCSRVNITELYFFKCIAIFLLLRK